MSQWFLSESAIKEIRDSRPLLSISHPQWLIPRGAHAKEGDIVKRLWKRYYRLATAEDTGNLYVCSIVNESGWVLPAKLAVPPGAVGSIGDGN